MIGQNHRFHGLGSLRFTYKNSQTVRSGSVALRYVQNEARNTYRCAVVVSKKVSKSAVVRNRIRRRVMEIVRLQEANITKPFDMVITVYDENAATMPAAEIGELISGLLQKAGIVSK